MALPLTDPTSSDTDKQTERSISLDQKNYLVPFYGFILYCVVSAVACVAWEDHACTFLWPNRHRTMLASVEPATWGSRTIKGLGFGSNEHRYLDLISEDQTTTLIPSYNEVMLNHRTVNVGLRKQQDISAAEIEQAIHTMVLSLERVWYIQHHSDSYDSWEELRSQLGSKPLSELSGASATLRKVGLTDLRDTVGFDWGSCGWRHCGALADAQEALDEIDYLLGVLEPFEINFCLDIVERSIRDILATAPWPIASKLDRDFFLSMPEYVSKVKDENSDGQIDGEYLRALQELRVD